MAGLLFAPTTSTFKMPRSARALLLKTDLRFQPSATQEELGALSDELKGHVVHSLTIEKKAKKLDGLPEFPAAIQKSVKRVSIDAPAFTDWHSLSQFESLEELSVLYSCKTLPEDFSFLRNVGTLRVINSKATKLTKLPDVSTLELVDMKIPELPALPASLTKLKLGGLKKVKQLPDVFGDLPQLTEIRLEHMTLRGLPPSLIQHTGLETLHLEYTNLSKLAPKDAIDLPKLRTLRLEGRFRKWPKKVSLPALDDLNLLCWVTVLPELPDTITKFRVVAPLQEVTPRFAALANATITCFAEIKKDLDPAVLEAWGKRLGTVEAEPYVG